MRKIYISPTTEWTYMENETPLATSVIGVGIDEDPINIGEAESRQPLFNIFE